MPDAADQLRTDQFREEFAGKDVAYYVLKFLSTRIGTPLDLHQSQTFQRCSSEEQRALDFIAEESGQSAVSAERDQFLIMYADGHATIGHSDWRSAVNQIPLAVATARTLDAAMFGTSFESPKNLFAWIWAARK